jgi:hypothetical protein
MKKKGINKLVKNIYHKNSHIFFLILYLINIIFHNAIYEVILINV